MVEVNLKGPLPRSKEGYDNIVVIAVPTTKYAEMHSIGGQTSEVVCRVIKGRISRYGLLKKLHSDNGPCFVNTSFQQFCADDDIEHTLSPLYRTSPYELVYKEHPRSKFEMFTEKISPRTMEEKNN